MPGFLNDIILAIFQAWRSFFYFKEASKRAKIWFCSTSHNFCQTRVEKPLSPEPLSENALKMAVQTSINISKVLESYVVYEISNMLLSNVGIRWGGWGGKKLLNKTWAISFDAETSLFKLFLIFKIAENKSLTVLLAKYFAACQIFLVLSRKSFQCSFFRFLRALKYACLATQAYISIVDSIFSSKLYLLAQWKHFFRLVYLLHRTVKSLYYYYLV